jgi:hypothetical protein
MWHAPLADASQSLTSVPCAQEASQPASISFIIICLTCFSEICYPRIDAHKTPNNPTCHGEFEAGEAAMIDARHKLDLAELTTSNLLPRERSKKDKNC